MMKKITMVAALAVAALAADAQVPAAAQGAVHGVNKADMDMSVRPGDDFYQYAGGGWLKANPMKPEYSSYGVFNDLAMQAQGGLSDFLWGIPGWIAGGLIFICGHTLNIALSCLSAYVHSIRLTFVEYFKNSGYDGRGVTYKPFSSLQKTETKK